MNVELSFDLDCRTETDNIDFNTIVNHFYFLTVEVNNLLSLDSNWYETGYSRKQALSNIAFTHYGISEGTLSKWIKYYKKEQPLFLKSIWDGGDDENSNGISYRKMFFDERNRASINLELTIPKCFASFSRVLNFNINLASAFECSQISLDTRGYRLHKRNVFPDRLSVGWMLYIPHIISSELIPEAARVVPVMDGEKQKGTIIISTEEIFDGDNPAHIAKANDIEIKLLDLGFLPLMTEL